jgi:hypothetical protein
MKTKLIFLVLLIVNFSCSTNNKPVSDAQKEKIKGEVKEVANAMFKGCEEANVNMAVESFLDSPDFVYIYNGVTFNYKEVVDVLKPLFGELINQEITITNEKYVFLDNSTVIYTTNCKFLENYKDGHAIVSDPMVVQVTFKKINNKWKTINGVESSVRQNVQNSETSRELNQVELMKQTTGTWKCEFPNKDSSIVAEMKSFGNGGIEVNQKWFFKDKILFDQKFVSGYDKKSDKYIGAMINKDNPEISLSAYWFTSKNKYERIPFENISNPEQATFKMTYEYKSHDLMIGTIIEKNKPDRTFTWVRVK